MMFVFVTSTGSVKLHNKHYKLSTLRFLNANFMDPLFIT